MQDLTDRMGSFLLVSAGNVLLVAIVVGVAWLAYRVLARVARTFVARAAAAPLPGEVELDAEQRAIRRAERSRRLQTVVAAGLRLVRWFTIAVIATVVVSVFLPSVWAADGGPHRRQEDRDDDGRDDRDDEPADEPEAGGDHGLQAPAPLRAPDRPLLGVELRLPGQRSGGSPGDEGPGHAGQHAVGEPGHPDDDRDEEHIARRNEEERDHPVGEILHRGLTLPQVPMAPRGCSTPAGRPAWGLGGAHQSRILRGSTPRPSDPPRSGGRRCLPPMLTCPATCSSSPCSTGRWPTSRSRWRAICEFSRPPGHRTRSRPSRAGPGDSSCTRWHRRRCSGMPAPG